MAMGYRFIFSQMFDVRPRNTAGDLDLERMAKTDEFLNLRPWELEAPSKRTINLRPKRAHLKILDEILSREAVISPVREALGRNIDFLSDYYDGNIPDETDILSVFDIIEATDELLKRTQEFQTAYNIPIRKIIEEAQEEAEEVQQPEIQEVEPEFILPEIQQPEPAFIFPEVQAPPVKIQAEPVLNFDSEYSYGREPDLTFWSRPQAEAQTESVPGSEFLTPEFLLGRQAAKESLGWRAGKKPLIIFLAAAFLIFSPSSPTSYFSWPVPLPHASHERAAITPS